MTDQILAQILSQRSMGRRITSLNSVLRTNGRPVPGNNQTASALTVDVTELQLTLTARVGPQQLPARMNAIVQRQGNGSRITWRQW
jgi:hypothetical protein